MCHSSVWVALAVMVPDYVVAGDAAAGMLHSSRSLTGQERSRVQVSAGRRLLGVTDEDPRLGVTG